MTVCELRSCGQGTIAMVRHPCRGPDDEPDVLRVCGRHAKIIVEDVGGEVVDE